MTHIRRQHFFLLLLVLALAIGIRLFHLSSVPNSISDDELEFVLNAKSIFYTGYDITGSWSPFNNSYRTNIFPPFPYLLTYLWAGIMPLRYDLARIPYIFSYICLIALLYGITTHLIDKRAAILVSIMAAINPWGVFFSRTAFESPVSTMFYLSALFLLLVTKGNFILISILPLAAAFFTYTGGKLLLLPYSIVVFLYAWLVIHKRNYTTQFVILFFSVLALLSYQIVSIRSEAIGSRVTELASPYSPFISATVLNKRHTSATGIPLQIFSNRFISYGEFIITKYAEVYAPKLLYLTGEVRPTYSLSYHGYFYLIDIFFLPIGLYFLFRRKRSVFYLLVSLLVIAPIPAILGTVGTGFVALRGALMFPVMVMIQSVGLYYLLTKKWENIRLPIVLTGFFIVLYTLSFANFMYTYLYQYGIYSSEAFGFSRRVLGKYIQSSHNTAITIITGDPNSVLRHYLFASNSYTRSNALEMSALFNKPVIQYKNLTIISCDHSETINPNSIVVIETGRCEKKYPKLANSHVSIPILSDGGEVYKIYGDTVCNTYSLKKYPTAISVSDFTVEQLTTKRFCEQFITNLAQ